MIYSRLLETRHLLLEVVRLVGLASCVDRPINKALFELYANCLGSSEQKLVKIIIGDPESFEIANQV